MKFYVFEHGRIATLPAEVEYPYVKLVHDNWDDYSYRTTFVASIHILEDETVELGSLKILHRRQESGYTSMPDSPFEKLGREYCSLGHGIDYYEAVYKLGRKIRGAYLKGIGDVAWDDERLDDFEELEGFQVSLMRFSGSERFLEEATHLLKSDTRPVRQRRRGFSIKFKTRLARNVPMVRAEFSFLKKGILPNRVNALIGYNGTGKTKLLSNMAVVASEYGYDTKEARYNRAAGRFLGTRPPIKRVIVVSYSAFDDFVIPNEEEAERVGYIYCGLRTRSPGSSNSEDEDEDTFGLKTPETIEREFLDAFRRIEAQDRGHSWSATISPLLEDGSFRRIGTSGLVGQTKSHSLRRFFRSLSSGHKIVLKILAELVGFMDGKEPTLVLIDEPETHLHPPLLASMLRGIRECLDELNGFAIVATHSPVVLQELPSRYIHVLRRIGDGATISPPAIETFGESVGQITEQVFDLDDSATDWHATLRELASENTIGEVESLFDNRLGFAARSYIASEKASAED
jgi:energy-coupling factor transporter ATP-binding protein EcfA2